LATEQVWTFKTTGKSPVHAEIQTGDRLACILTLKVYYYNF
jgi:hypothetical protein